MAQFISCHLCQHHQSSNWSWRSGFQCGNNILGEWWSLFGRGTGCVFLLLLLFMFSASCSRAALSCTFWGPLFLTQMFWFLLVRSFTKKHHRACLMLQQSLCFGSCAWFNALSPFLWKYLATETDVESLDYEDLIAWQTAAPGTELSIITAETQLSK